ncbi:hypothetical protein FJTKL_05026 [Diaporthe vaccinii]|uniref:40S ribosomal protein S3 n=1 Tax=Diaporthe vaccinii TaxID=105482 RepID=A0ABR4EYX7_9PEZI
MADVRTNLAFQLATAHQTFSLCPIFDFGRSPPPPILYETACPRLNSHPSIGQPTITHSTGIFRRDNTPANRQNPFHDHPITEQPSQYGGPRCPDVSCTPSISPKHFPQHQKRQRHGVGQTNFCKRTDCGRPSRGNGFCTVRLAFLQTLSRTQPSKRRKFVADGVFYAELNEFFQRELAEEGYSGVEVRVTPTVTDIIIRATHTQEVLGEQGRRIRELTSLIQKRFKFPENSVSLYAAKVQNRGLSAVAQCESLRYKLLNGLAVRRACYGVLRFIMESGAKGCEVVVSGKLRAARAKSMKFTDGFMIHSGQPAKEFIDSATRHVLLRQGVLGIKVKIMRGSDPEGKAGPQKSLPDAVTILEPKDETPVVQPVSQDYGAKAAQVQAAAEAARAQEEQAEGEEQPAAAEQ